MLSIILAVAVPGAASAATTRAAIDLGVTAFSPDSASAREIISLGRIFVRGPSEGAGTRGLILLPPQPGGSVLALPCGAPLSCEELDIPSGLGASGRVIGSSAFFVPPEFYFYRAATWDATGTVKTYLTPLSSLSIWAYSAQALHLNASDVIVGSAYSPPLGINVPVVWSSPTAAPVTLANLGTDRGPYPTRISDGGAIIGNVGGPVSRAVVWSTPAAAFSYLGEIPGPGGTSSLALDLDEQGRIVGSSNGPLSGSQLRAALWRPSGGGHTVEALPVPWAGGSCNEATAIEAGGWIAGNCEKAWNQRRGVIWHDVGGLVTFEYELEPLPGDASSTVYGLIGKSFAVGSSGYPAHPVIWDLDPFSPPEAPALGPSGLILLAASLTLAALYASARSR